MLNKIGRARLAGLLAAAGMMTAGMALAATALASAGGVSGQAATPPYGAGLAYRAIAPQVANDEWHAPVTTTPAPTTTPSPTPTPTTPSGYTVTLNPETGFIFEPPATISSGAYDTWWSGGRLVVPAGAGIQYLGNFADVSEVPAPPVDGYSSLPVLPGPGDGFALKLGPRGSTGYAPHAKIWVHRDSPAGGSITFDWRYYAGEPCNGTHATITALDKPGQVVTVQGSGDMTGWKVVSAQPKPIPFSFPAGWVLTGSVQIKAATAPFPPSATQLFWQGLPVWNQGTRNDAQLYNCEGTLVQTYEDHQ